MFNTESDFTENLTRNESRESHTSQVEEMGRKDPIAARTESPSFHSLVQSADP